MGFWSGFPRGTTVTVRVLTTVSKDKRDAIRRSLDQVSEATRGAIATRFELTEDSRALQPPGQTVNAYVHDVVGHGIPGMCHIDGDLIGGAENSLMSGGPGVLSGDIALELTPRDIEDLKAAYGSSLDPGTVRSDFVAEGLVDP